MTEHVATRFVVCLRNDGHPASLEVRKLYAIVPDEDAERDGDLRVIDESGEDYLYPAAWFATINLPEALEAALLQAS